MLKVEVVEFKTGHIAVFVGELQVGKVFKDDQGWVVQNETPSFRHWVFRDFKAIELFALCNINNRPIPMGMGITYRN